MLEENNQLRAEDEAAELCWLKGRGGKERKVCKIKEKLLRTTLKLNLKVKSLSDVLCEESSQKAIACFKLVFVVYCVSF